MGNRRQEIVLVLFIFAMIGLMMGGCAGFFPSLWGSDANSIIITDALIRNLTTTGIYEIAKHDLENSEGPKSKEAKYWYRASNITYNCAEILVKKDVTTIELRSSTDEFISPDLTQEQIAYINDLIKALTDSAYLFTNNQDPSFEQYRTLFMYLPVWFSNYTENPVDRAYLSTFCISCSKGAIQVFEQKEKFGWGE